MKHRALFPCRSGLAAPALRSAIRIPHSALRIPCLLGFAALALALAPARAADTRCYEMRTYYAAPGKFEAMHARFRNHTVKLFAKHGMENVGYWTPMDEKDGATNTLIYLLAYPSREAREAAWKAFMDDPDWKSAFADSEKGGKLVERAEQRFLTATDFSPELKLSAANPPRAFELRTYTAETGRLPALLARFRDHTCKLFERHGIRNFGYWTPAPGQPGADNTLIYLVAHPNREAAKQSWDAFRADPDWLTARKASEEKAGGSLTARDGVKSVYLAPADYSPTK